jgi:polysaccharide export outer membrane protein
MKRDWNGRAARIATSLITLGIALGVSLLSAAAPAYKLGPGDKVAVTLPDLKEITISPSYIAPDGSLELPYAGRLEANGLTTQELARLIETNLEKVARNPHVVVEVTEYGSQPVSVLGAVEKPGVHQLRGGKTLIEVLALAEGVAKDAGYTVTITRPKTSGPIPLSNSVEDPDGNFSMVSIGLKTLMDGTKPSANILIRPNDVISVPRSELVYVVGNVHKPGAFTLFERESVSVLQAIALAEGLDPNADAQHARILRPNVDGGERQEIVVDLSKILSSKAKDEMMRPNDILFVPNSSLKSVSRRMLDMGVQMATGVVVFRR